MIENGDYSVIKEFLQLSRSKKFMLVCSNSFDKLLIKDYIYSQNIPFVRFSDFTPNPQYEQAITGAKVFNDNGCDAIIAVGGGSAIDTAKCIKLFSAGDKNTDLVRCEYKDTKIPLVAIPTTAGTGSEATHFAVIYKNGKKYSVAHQSLLPSLAVLDYSFLRNLSDYQKKSTLLDALCQAIESFWSVYSTDESKEYSKCAIEMIMRSAREYVFENKEKSSKEIIIASNLAGKAINISKTTAAHAMSYKITSNYGLAHGHAVSVCLPLTWKYIIDNSNKCIDVRGEDYLKSVLTQIAQAMGGKKAEDGIEIFNQLILEFNLAKPRVKEEHLENLTSSVNVERLKNTPVTLGSKEVYGLYSKLVI
ncbi:MAG: phosphonoacetaldehyde reductase [Clostridia bacterium]|nr:phosphonoacetaldehyde reductase [Clostridia bacterium]